jgi:hypothetical protein
MADRTTAGQDFGKWGFKAAFDMLGSSGNEPSLTDILAARCDRFAIPEKSLDQFTVWQPGQISERVVLGRKSRARLLNEAAPVATVQSVRRSAARLSSPPL